MLTNKTVYIQMAAILNLMNVSFMNNISSRMRADSRFSRLAVDYPLRGCLCITLRSEDK